MQNSRESRSLILLTTIIVLSLLLVSCEGSTSNREQQNDLIFHASQIFHAADNMIYFVAIDYSTDSTIKKRITYVVNATRCTKLSEDNYNIDRRLLRQLSTKVLYLNPLTNTYESR